MINVNRSPTLGWTLVALVCCTASAHAQSGRLQVNSIKPLLITAIDRGVARGVLVGPAADALARQFESREPILVDVRAVRPLTDPECKRLEVKTIQARVRESAGPPAQKELVYEINYCRNGRFPEERLSLVR